VAENQEKIIKGRDQTLVLPEYIKLQYAVYIQTSFSAPLNFLTEWTDKYRVLRVSQDLYFWVTEAGIIKNNCAINSGSSEVELRFCLWLILFKYWTGWLDQSSSFFPYYAYRGAWPKGILRWQDLRLIHVQRMTQNSASVAFFSFFVRIFTLRSSNLRPRPFIYI
jgi:hypothetical protein